ncbi:MAG: STAS domain-containing protein [Acidimicrobiia bacterium]|nr:STAS domain-containing protein [Acidimicrobiia bacterium]MDH5237500.1 STAS domain-containing protein [Acidimicrobiia bacterium]
MLEIHVEENDDHTTCRPVGEIDAYTVGTFRESLTELSERQRLIVDLSDVPFMDSAGLGALIGGIRRVREHEGAVVVVSTSATITRLLHTTGFDRIVPVVDNHDAAGPALDNPPT